MSDNDGGPAFPTGTQVSQNNTTGETTICQYLSDGMTLRDYFAAKVMNSQLNQQTRPYADYDFDNAAIRSYEMADAMLKVRNK